MNTAFQKEAAVCQYQGGGLSIYGAMHIGTRKYDFPFAKTPLAGLNYSTVNVTKKDPPTVILRPTQYEEKPGEIPCSIMFSYRFINNAELSKKKIIFRLVSDADGFTIGSAFAADVDSNYPEYTMSLPKTEIRKASFGILTERILPGDYSANILVKYWNENPDRINASVVLEVGYANEDDDLSMLESSEVDLTCLGRVQLFPNQWNGKTYSFGDAVRNS